MNVLATYNLLMYCIYLAGLQATENKLMQFPTIIRGQGGFDLSELIAALQ